MGHGGHRCRRRPVSCRPSIVGRVLDRRKLRVNGRNLRFWRRGLQAERR